MKSILKTINVSSISSFALIGILSVLISACGSDADSSDPRRFDTPLYVNDDPYEDFIHNAGPEIVLIGDPIIELDIDEEYVERGAVTRDIWDGRNLKDQVPTTTAGYVIPGSLLVSSDVEPNSTEYEVELSEAEDLEVGMEVDIEINGLIVTRLPKNTAEITSIEVIEPAATTTVVRLKFQNAISHALQEGLDHLAPGTLSGGSDSQGKILINVGVQPLLIQGSVDSTQSGNYTISYTATDSSNNSNTITRAVIVADRTGPVITITGSNPLLVAFETTFELPDATFSDAFDSQQNEASQNTISSTGTVDTNTIGVYTITYTATDNAGNQTTLDLTVVVEPVYGDEVVIFKNGATTAAWQPGLNGYDQDNNWQGCPGATACPNLDFGIVNDSERGDVVFVSHADTDAQAGFFIETSTPNDLRGAEVNGKLQFDIWSESGVTIFVSADCVYPCQGGPVLLENVGVGEWQTVAIPAVQLMTQGLNSITMENVSTFSIFSDGWRDATFRIDNVSWLCEFTCTGTDQPDRVYTPWDRADKTLGYNAPTSYEGYDLVWSDEFDGTEVNTSNWNLINQGGGFGNFELQYYREENASIDTDDDLLVISAEIQKNDDENLPGNELYSSAKLTTQDLFEFKHGRVDIRAVVAEGKGMWSAGWMLGANVDDIGWPRSGEVDIFDTIGGQLNGNPQEGMIVHNAYWNTQGPNTTGDYNESYYNQSAWGERRINATNDGVTFSNQFHVFSLEWDEDKIRFFVDGEYAVGKDLALSGGVPCAGGSGLSCVGETYNQDFFLILNVAVGGDWPGAPDETTQFPRGMLVDYVRVYQTPAQQAAQQAAQ